MPGKEEMKINPISFFSDGMKDEFETKIESANEAGDILAIPVLVRGTYFPPIREDAINPPEGPEFYIESVYDQDNCRGVNPSEYNSEEIQEAYLKERE